VLTFQDAMIRMGFATPGIHAPPKSILTAESESSSREFLHRGEWP
jgi:hypothetical protein